MYYPEICLERCQSCNPCLAWKVCRTRAIMKPDPDEPPYIELGRCNRCGKCVLSCCCEAIVMRSPNGNHSNERESA